VSDEVRNPREIYAAAVDVVEKALDTAARAQWDGRFPDTHRERRALIELRREVPNDRLDPQSQVIRDLLTCYADVLTDQQTRATYERGPDALSEELRNELGRLRPRAARHGLPVLTDDLKAFRAARAPDRRPRPEAPRPAAPPRPAAAAEPAKRRRRRSRRRSSSPQ
jgi:hypothetical protein